MHRLLHSQRKLQRLLRHSLVLLAAGCWLLANGALPAADAPKREVLKVEMGGACEGCPLSLTTLHGWVEGTVRQFFPDIERIELS